MIVPYKPREPNQRTFVHVLVQRVYMHRCPRCLAPPGLDCMDVYVRKYTAMTKARFPVRPHKARRAVARAARLERFAP